MLRQLDPNIQEQALLDGTLWRTTLRQLLSPLIASFCIVTVLAVQEFAIDEPTGISVIILKCGWSLTPADSHRRRIRSRRRLGRGQRWGSRQ